MKRAHPQSKEYSTKKHAEYILNTTMPNCYVKYINQDNVEITTYDSSITHIIVEIITLNNYFEHYAKCEMSAVYTIPAYLTKYNIYVPLFKKNSLSYIILINNQDDFNRAVNNATRILNIILEKEMEFHIFIKLYDVKYTGNILDLLKSYHPDEYRQYEMYLNVLINKHSIYKNYMNDLIAEKII